MCPISLFSYNIFYNIIRILVRQLQVFVGQALEQLVELVLVFLVEVQIRNERNFLC